MATIRNFTFHIDEAKTLASLIGAYGDLSFVVKCCDRMIERYAGDHLKETPFDIVGFTTPVDLLDWEALSSAACVAYARCFASGVREKLGTADHLTKLSSDQRSLHDFVLEVRNKHIAHSVNAFEQNLVTVQIGDDFHSSSQISTIGASSPRHLGFRFDVPAKLRDLAIWWSAEVKAAIEAERAMLLALAHGMALDDLRSGEVKGDELASQDYSNVSKRRKWP